MRRRRNYLAGVVVAALIAAALGGLAGPAQADPCPPAECPAGGGHKVHRQKAWAPDNLYKVEQSGSAVNEPHFGAKPKPLGVTAGTWLPIACQATTSTGGQPAVWDRIANVGWVPDAWLKTFYPTPVPGAPPCAIPHADHVWNVQPWTADSRYRVERNASGWHKPKREGVARPNWVRQGTWVKIKCQVRGQKVKGSRLWDNVQGQFVPDGALKTWTAGRLGQAPKCGVPTTVPSDAGHFVALGDSYSSGEGTEAHQEDYIAGAPPGREKQCDRSYYAWSRSLRDAWLPPRHMDDATDFLACQGDVSSDVLTKQIPHMNRKATAVTITIGGNDMGFADILEACLLNRDCSGAVRDKFGPIRRHRSTGKLRAVAAKLTNVYKAIHRRARHATVVVVGYPGIFGTHIDGCFGLSDDDLPMLHLAEKRLNQTIRDAVHARGPNFHYVSLGGVFDGHQACTGGVDEWITSPYHLQYYRGYFHPNAAGQQAIAAAVKARLPKLFTQL